MKALLFLIALALSLIVKSQTSVYHPFPTTNANWVYQYFNDNHQATSSYGGYSITGDTIIFGTNYKKISGCDGMHYACNSGGIRDSNKVIYFRPDTSAYEYVLYDFNLQLGDTIIHPFGGAVCSNDTVTVWQVDSILCSDGYHRKLGLSSYATWIEGIGSDAYLLRPADILCVSGNDILECMITDSGFSYPPGIGSCIASILEPTINNGIWVFPNPSREKITITSQNQFTQLEIINAIGSVVYFESIRTLKTDIDISFLMSGFYFVRVFTDKGEMVNRFVKL